MKKRFLFLLLIIGVSTACSNDCQQLCVDIRDFAEKCDEPFTNEDFSECMRAQGQKNGEERQACRQARETPLSEEWTCEDIEVYFD